MRTIGYDIDGLGINQTLNGETPATTSVFEGGAGVSLGSGEFIGNTTLQDGYLKSSNYAAGSTGWYLAPDTAEFNVGVSVDSLDIPDITTANSFHVESDGDTYWGANVATGLAAAPASITKAGVGTFSNITATGTINATGGYIGAANVLPIDSSGVNVGVAGSVRGGQTAYHTGTGFFLGYSTAAYKFSIGNPAGNFLTWDGSALTIKGSYITYAAGTILLVESVIPSTTLSTSYVKVKEIGIGGGSGTLSFSFDLAIEDVPETCKGKIYRNGVAVGTEFTATTDVNIGWETFTEDISGWSAGDLMQLYIKSSGSGKVAYSANFTASADKSLIPYVSSE